jgi:ATP-dependent Zn protease
MNSLISGNLTDVNLALPSLGYDLARLGFLIDLANLGNFGLPSTVFRQLATVTNLTPRITIALKQVGFTTNQIERITDPDATLTDTEEAKLYRAMLLITDVALQQVCNILGITLPVAGVNTTSQPQNPGLATMADLLNPVKIFPTSYPSLTVRTYNQNTTSELRSIYLDATGNVNSKLTEYLPRYVITVVPA